MRKLKRHVAQMVTDAKARIEEIDAADAIALRNDPGILIVDIRDIRERQREGVIPGAVHAPRGMLEFWVDPESPYYKEALGDPAAKLVLHCASGWRSALATATLTDMGVEAAHITTGFKGWVEAGGPVEPLPERS